MSCSSGEASNWNWKSGNPMRDVKGGIPFDRNYFDCGMYYWDGTFNVVKFSKGMLIYHGSAALANAVVTFPLGIQFYKPFDIANPNSNVRLGVAAAPAQPLPVNIVANSDKEIWEILANTPGLNISASWFGDYDIAKFYSQQSSQVGGFSCGDKCINVYRLNTDVVFFLLDDAYNIAKLLTTRDPNLVPNTIKQHLVDMFQLSPTKGPPWPLPTRTGVNTPFNRLQYNLRRQSLRTWDLSFAKWACATFKTYAGQLSTSYAGYAATVQPSAVGAPFHLEFVFCNATDYLERAYDNPRDWQHPSIPTPSRHPDLSKFMNQLKLYETTNFNFHAGNLYEHSVWSLLIFEQLAPIFLPGNPDLIRITAFAAFIHDIGKMVDPNTYRLPPGGQPVMSNCKRAKIIYYAIPNHPQIGAHYVSNKFPEQPPYFDPTDIDTRTGCTWKHRGYIDIKGLFTAFGIDYNKYQGYVAFLIRRHWDFGTNVLAKTREAPSRETQILQDYIRVCYNSIKVYIGTINKADLKRLVQALIVLSLADIKGTQPYGIDALRAAAPPIPLNGQSTHWPWIQNVSKVYRGNNLWTAAKVYDRGLQYLKIISNMIEQLPYPPQAALPDTIFI